MKFVVDENLPDVLSAWLADRGHDVVHVRDWLRASATDAEIWRRAQVEQRAIVTKDDDFRLRRSLAPGPTVLLLAVGNRGNAALLRDIEAAWPKAEAALAAGRATFTIPRHDRPDKGAD